MPKITPRISRKSRCSHSHSPSPSPSLHSICKFLIFFIAAGDQSCKLWVGGQQFNRDCHDDLYLSDKNGDGKVDAEEYVEFCRLRLEQHMLQQPEDQKQVTSLATPTTFVLLPAGLQSNFYTLSCLCSRFEFDDSILDNEQCCVGENAHLSVVTAGSSVTMNDEESIYTSLVCSFTNRAIGDMINTAGDIQTFVDIDTILPTTSPTTHRLTTLPTNVPTAVTISTTAQPSLRTAQPTTTPTSIPSMPPTISMTSATATPSMKPSLPTNAPTAVTISTTAQPSSRTAQPTTTPTSIPSMPPTISKTSATATPSMKPSLSSSQSSPTVEPTDYPANINIKTSYTILVDEEQHITVDDVYTIWDDCIEAMNLLATRVSTQLWFHKATIENKSSLYDRIFVELPTMVEQVEEMGFTSTPKIINRDPDGDNESGENNNKIKVFAGGPCPTTGMMNIEDNSKIDEQMRRYSCLEVSASILLRVKIDNNFVESGVSADDIENLYSESLDREILRGELANIIEDMIQSSVVIVASGQTVSTITNTITQTPGSVVRVGVIVGLVAGVLLLILILVQLSILCRSMRNQTDDEKETIFNPCASTDIIGEEHIAAENNDFSGDLGRLHQVKSFALTSSLTDVGNHNEIDSSIQSEIWQQQKHRRNHGEHSDTNSLTTNTFPYFRTDVSPEPVAGADDAKSTGGISQESDAGWSEAYTSSMGSASDDSICSRDSPYGTDDSPTTTLSDIKPIIPDSEPADACGNSKTSVASASSVTPKSIQLLDDTDDDILIHEDFSDEDEDDTNLEQNVSNHNQALIRRISRKSSQSN